MPKLTTQEATQLINMLKQLVEKNIYFPNQGERKELEAEGVVDQSEKFIISIIRGGRDPKKCSYQARMKTGGTPLLRLDITGPSIAHQNPDGTIIYGPHLLAYNEDFDMKYAVRFDCYELLYIARKRREKSFSHSRFSNDMEKQSGEFPQIMMPVK